MPADTFTVNGIPFLGVDQAPAAGGLNDGRYWYGSVLIPNFSYDRRPVTRPGVNGIKIIKAGRRGKDISAQIMYVGATMAAVYALFDADKSAMENAYFTVTPPGRGNIENVQLESFSEGQMLGSIPDDKYVLLASLKLSASGI